MSVETSFRWLDHHAFGAALVPTDFAIPRQLDWTSAPASMSEFLVDICPSQAFSVSGCAITPDDFRATPHTVAGNIHPV
jgi:hypothetical protein